LMRARKSQNYHSNVYALISFSSTLYLECGL
jgi:hypothetical protein